MAGLHDDVYVSEYIKLYIVHTWHNTTSWYEYCKLSLRRSPYRLVLDNNWRQKNMPVDRPSYLVGRTDEKVLTMFWSSTNYRCLWTGPNQHILVGEDRSDRQKTKLNRRNNGKTKVWYFYYQKQNVCTFSFVFSLICDKLICERPMCDKLIDKSTAVWYK